jgi:beta-lactamase superfamily II metal-dependent hydrolase
MYEVDFLPVESESGPGSKSGDAIALRFTLAATGLQVIVAVDGGYASVGNDLVEHIPEYYGTRQIDLVISTHPDADHLNGLATVVEQLSVGELLVHQPRLHRYDVSEFSNLEALDVLLEVARQRGVVVTEPFTGLTRFNGQLRVLGPTSWYYEQLLDEHLAEARSGVTAGLGFRSSKLLGRAGDLLDRALSYLPIETLTDEGVTGPRNNTSVITCVQADGHRVLLTGDAGIPALEYAATEYESQIGGFYAWPLSLFQVPHHGSRRNVGPTILDRILGPRGAAYNATTSVVSSAKADPKHPSPKVVNALKRRGSSVYVTEGKILRHGHDYPLRPGWGPATELPALSEDEDDE